VLSVLPIGGFALLVLAFVGRGVGGCAALLAASTVWGGLVALLTETLSVRRALSPGMLAAAWLSLDVAVLIDVTRHRRALAEALRAGWRARLDMRRAGLGAGHLALLSAVGLVVVLVGLTAIVSPPNTWDAMQYHMPRLVHWLEHRSVAFYATHDWRQLHMSPGAEFLRLQLHALSGADRLDNLVQWGAYAVSVIGVTLIARSLGAGIGGQVLAAVIVASIPQGVLQASSVKSDWAVALWLVALTYWLLGFRRDPSIPMALAIGASIGLACLTRATAYLIAPTLVAAFLTTWPRDVAWAFIKRLPIVLVLATLMIGGHAVRNYSFFGSPLGPASESPLGEYRYTADKWSMPAVVSTIVRNVALHLGTTSVHANAVTTHALERLIRAVGGDPNDPRTTWTGTMFRVPDFSLHEEAAGNPVHLVLLTLTLGVVVWGLAHRRHAEVTACSVGLLIAFVGFCAILRWQPWHARLHLPWFVLWSAPVAVVLCRAWPRTAVWGIGPILLCLAIPFVIGNDSRPLAWPGKASILGRTRIDMYFAQRPELLASYRAAADAVRATGCRHIGLPLSPERPYEYPLLMLLDAGHSEVRVSHIGVWNRSAMYVEGSSDEVCAVICPACTWEPGGPSTRHRLVWSEGGHRVFVGSWPVFNGSARVTVAPSRVRPGQQIAVGVDVRNPPHGTAAELFVGVVMPDLRSARFFDATGALGPLTRLDASHPPIRPAPPGSRFDERSLVEFTLASAGRYHVVLAMMRQGAERRGAFELSDLVALDTRELIVTR
jgi:hypothetical protein